MHPADVYKKEHLIESYWSLFIIIIVIVKYIEIFPR